MAASPLGRGELPFKIPTDIEAIKAIDEEFWRLHDEWRSLQDEFARDSRCPDESEESQLMFDRAIAARDAMFLRGIWTAAALSIKLAVCREGDAKGMMAQELQPGVTVFDMIEWDCGRVFQREAGLWNPILAIE